MAFESVQIVSTRNGSSSHTGTYREDLLQGEVVGLSLSSMVGVTSVLWEIIGRPEFSAAGGAGPEPVSLGVSPTSSFTVDSDAGAVHKDGTYLVRATINPGSPGQVRKTAALARVSGITIAGPSGARTLRKPGGFEALEDTSSATCFQGYAKMENRWFELLRSVASGGGVIETLAGAYSVGAGAGDQTLLLNDGNGGGVIIDGSAGGFTGASALRINTAGSTVVVDRATGNIGVGTTTPASSVHAKGTAPALRLDRTGGAAFDLANVADVLSIINRTSSTTLVTIPAAGGLRSDLGLSIGAAPATGPALAMGAGSTAGLSTANTGRIRYNELTQQWETSTNGGAYVAFGSGAGTFVELDGIATGTAQLSAFTPPASGHVEALVKTVRDVFYLDRASTLTADGITVVTAVGGGRWIRRNFSDPFWQAVTSWGIDPAQTFGTPGNDEAVGSPSAPIKSMAEWRRRINGARYTSTVTIKALSGSTNNDDGILYGYTCDTSAAKVVILGTPTVLFTGTLSSVVAYSGNTRASVTDTALATSWTVSGGISTSGSGSRYIRRQGSGSRPYAPTLKDLGSKAMQPGVIVNWDETDVSTLAATETNFSNGDTYEVVTLPSWPSIQQMSGQVRVQCFDVAGFVAPSPTRLAYSLNLPLIYVLCGFPTQLNPQSSTSISFYSCVFTNAVGYTFTGDQFFPINSGFIGTIAQFQAGSSNWPFPNVTVNSELRFWHGSMMGSIIGLRVFDNTTTGVSVRHNSSVRLAGAYNGSGNSGSLVVCDTAGILYGAENITATTSSGTPYTVGSTAYAAPTVDLRSGDAIYNASTPPQVIVADAVNSQAAVPLHQVNALISAGIATFTPGSVIFAAPSTGALSQDNANLFWDPTNRRLGIGTNAPTTALDITSTSASVNARVQSTLTTGTSQFLASNGTAAGGFGVTGTAYVDGGTHPALGASMAFATTGTTMFIGANAVITLQTGSPQAERLRILSTGEVQLSSLSAGGMVRAAAGGQLAIGVDGTDFLAPPGGGLTPGSVLFASPAGKIAQDNANLFWDDPNNRLGVGTNVPAVDVHVKGAAPSLRLDRAGNVAFDIANITDTLSVVNRTSATTLVTVPSTGGLRSDLGVAIGVAPSTSSTLAMGAGSAAAVSTAGTGRIRYNEVLQQWETSANGGAYAPFGSAGGLALVFDGISTGTAQLSAYTPPASGLIQALVKSVRDVFYLDRTSTLTADGITIITAVGGGRWIRRMFSDPFWLATTAWFVDPTNTSTTASDENTGVDGTHQLRTRGEIFRRLGTQALLSAITINVGPGDLIAGDTYVSAVGTTLTTPINWVGVPTQVFSGTVTAYTARSGAGAQPTTMGITSIPSSWTASGLVDKVIEWTDGAGSFIRAIVVADLGNVSGIPTATLSPPISQANTQDQVFINGGTRPLGGTTVKVYSLPSLGAAVLSSPFQTFKYLSSTRWLITSGRADLTNCTGIVTAFGGNLSLINCNVFPGADDGSHNVTTAAGASLNINGGRVTVIGAASCRFSGHVSIGTLRPEGPAVFNTPGQGSVPADFEVFNTSTLTPAFYFGLVQGGRIISGGFVYGSQPSIADVVQFQARDGLLTLSHVPNITGATTVNFVLAGTSSLMSGVATRQLDDVNFNRVIGPSGPMLTDNRGQTILHVGSAAGVGTSAVNWNDVLGAVGGGALPTFTPGSIPFGSSGGGLTQDNANLFFDDANNRLGVGTSTPIYPVEVSIGASATGRQGYRAATASTATDAAAQFWATNGSKGLITGITGQSFTAVGAQPNLGSSTAYLMTSGASGGILYLGSDSVITMQTGSTQAERLKISAAGAVSISSLNSGGIVHGAAGTGLLSVGQIVTADITDQNVTMTKLEPINASKVLGYDGGTGPTGSPFDLTVVAPLRVPTGQGQLVFDTQFAQGSIYFQGASQVTQDNAKLFWSDSLVRLGVGTNAPLGILEARNDGNSATQVFARNENAGASAQAQVVATSSAGGGIGVVMGVAGSGFSATTNRPLVIANTPYVVPHFGSQNLYVGAPGTLIFATGTTEANRLQILASGAINVSSLSAGGMVTAAPSTGQLSVTTFTAGEIPFGAASGGGLSQDAHLVWDNTNKRLGLGASIGAPSFDLDVVNSQNGTTIVEVNNINSGAAATAEYIATNNGGVVMHVGVTGGSFTAAGSTPNLGASTAFLRTANGAPLYIGAITDITLQTGSTQAERLRVLSTGEVVIRNKLVGGTSAGATLVLQGTTDALHTGNVTSVNPFGVGRSPGVLGGVPQFAVAGDVSVTSSTGATLGYIVMNQSTVNITGSTNITTPGGFNCVDLEPHNYVTTVTIGPGGTVPAAATLCIKGSPSISGGGGFAGTTGAVGLWVQAPAQIDGNLRMRTGDIILESGAITISGTVGSGGLDTVSGRAAGSWLVGTSPTWAINATVDPGPSNPKVGFFSAAPIAKPTVSGSRNTDTWRTSVMAALSGLGLVNDSSTP